MKDIKVLGTGCANCRNTIALIETVAREKGLYVKVEKVEDIQAITAFGVMRTPGVVIDGKVEHAGGVPSRSKVEGWFAAAQRPGADAGTDAGTVASSALKA